MSDLQKINILSKNKLDSLDTTQYPNQLFGTTDDTEDKAIVFAESERQKSKNLFPAETVSGNGGKSIKLSKTLPVGTYTLSAIVTSDSSDTGCLVEAYANGKWITVFSVSKGIPQRTSSTRDLTSPIDEFRFYAGASDIGSHAFNFSEIQLEEGTEATDYQPYNGPIVHEKDVERNVLTAQLAVGQWYHPVKEQYAQLPLSLYNSTGTKLSLNNNRIFIGAGVKKVKVSGKIQIDHPAGGMYSYAKVFKNTQEMSLSNCGSTQAFTTNMPIIDAVMSVEEGDYLELQVYGTSTSCRIDGTLLRTSMTVEVVE